MPTLGRVRRQVARWWPGGADEMAGMAALELMDEMAAEAMAATAVRARRSRPIAAAVLREGCLR